jgi:broad specificity phosphatase PhoE
MSRLILMRHGQASFGADRYDALSETGRAQAQSTGEWLQEQGFVPTAVLHGPRNRQAATAREVGRKAEWNLAHHAVAALDEFAEGEEIFRTAQTWLGLPMQLDVHNRRQVLENYDRTCRAWAAGQVGIDGRISLDEFRSGTNAWLKAQTGDFKTSGQELFVVTSAGVIAAIVADTLGLDNMGWYQLLRVVRNASITEILYSKGRGSLLSFNGVQHLPPALTSSM